MHEIGKFYIEMKNWIRAGCDYNNIFYIHDSLDENLYSYLRNIDNLSEYALYNDLLNADIKSYVDKLDYVAPFSDEEYVYQNYYTIRFIFDRAKAYEVNYETNQER